MNTKERYRRLSVTCDLCIAALEECAIRMEPRREYKLYVGHRLWPTACMTLKWIGAEVKDHPFAPYINLVLTEGLGPHEWFLEGDAGEAWGSEGV